MPRPPGLLTLIAIFGLLGCARGPALPPSPAAPEAEARAAPAVKPAAPYRDVLSPVTPMGARRAAHSATVLPDGRMLLAGGFQDDGHGRELAIASAELFDPATETFTYTSTLNEPRDGHGAVLLNDGTVLIVGGWGINERTDTAEIYDPATGKFTWVGSLSAPRANLTATLLRDGRVLIAGGSRARNMLSVTAELYDPATRAFSPAGALTEGREGHTATLLDDGRVLLVGGTGPNDRVLRSAELFDPETGQFTATADLNIPRRKHAAVLLENGSVLVMGGSDQRDWRGQYRSTEVYDPATGAFMPGPELNSPRFKLADAVVTLSDGRVLVGGGEAHVELFNPSERRFALSQTLDEDYFFATATRLVDGRVLIAGGYNRNIEVTDRAWIFH